jgi:hypothetical protein
MQRRSQFDKSEKWAYFVSWCVVGGPSFLRGTARGLILPVRSGREIGNCIWTASVPRFHTFSGTTTRIMPSGGRYLSPRWNNCRMKCYRSLRRVTSLIVKWKEGAFNEVSADHSLEWLNGIGKRGGGIVGVTKTSSAVSRCVNRFN